MKNRVICISDMPLITQGDLAELQRRLALAEDLSEGIRGLLLRAVEGGAIEQGPLYLQITPIGPDGENTRYYFRVIQSTQRPTKWKTSIVTEFVPRHQPEPVSDEEFAKAI